jgi:hypothetical protein
MVGIFVCLILCCETVKQNVIYAGCLCAFLGPFFHIHDSFISIQIMYRYASQLKDMGVGAVGHRKWHVKV